MSSYTDVKNLIISNIKANGQREITGPILQDVLLNMLENSSEVEEILYNDLKALRDQGKLTPSRLYRIIDYITTTTQSNTRSAGHPFDVIVLALSETELSEQTWATMREGDTYFANSDLGAWKIWYCLDNDTKRFAWADDENGKGVIYRMIDEFDNDCPYDFKNIQFYRKWDADKSLYSIISSDNTSVPCYTFSSEGDASTTSFKDYSLSKYNKVYSNVIKEYINDAYSNQTLNNICFFGNNCYSNIFGDSCYDNSFRKDCYLNTFGNNFRYNTVGNNCWYNTFGNSFQYNALGNYCYRNTFGNNCWYNTFGNDCYNNTFGNDCYSNTFGNDCYSNTFRNYCYSNTVGNNCNYNIFGNECYGNTFGNGCAGNTFGNNCYNNTFGNYCYNNTAENYFQENAFGNNCENNSFGNNCHSIKFASDSSASTKYNYYRYNHFGNGCEYILFTGAETASSSKQVQNYKFAQGLKGTLDEYLTIDGIRSRAYDTYISKDTNGTIKETVIAEKLDKAVETSYNDLVTLRGSSKLVPGQQYRITDYTCTTTQSGTKSAGHVFDIIVTADDENTLNEVARVVKHEGDTYFANNDLNAWKIWYCLDNDTTRFAWADEENGKGVIYRMIDEWNNDVAYDFKNIQFYRQWNEATQLWSSVPENNTGVPCYTFSSEGADSTTEFTDMSVIGLEGNYSSDNFIGKYVNTPPQQLLNGNCLFGTSWYNNLKGSFQCTLGKSTSYNTMDTDFGIVIGNESMLNSFGSYCFEITLGNSCISNSFGSYCDEITLGDYWQFNSFGQYCGLISAGDGGVGNTFGNLCISIAFGDNFLNNTFGNNCWQIMFASDTDEVTSTKYNYYQYNHFGDGCHYILFTGKETASDSAQVQNYNFSQGLQGTDSAYLTIGGKRNREYETYISKDTDGTIKESVIAEFENRLDNCVNLTSKQTITGVKTFSAGIDLNGTRISKVGSPVNVDDAANKQYVDDFAATKQGVLTAGTGIVIDDNNTISINFDPDIFKVVSTLPEAPAAGDEKKIHLIPADVTESGNAYDEYAYVDGSWEKIGSFRPSIDLSDYAKTVDIPVEKGTGNNSMVQKGGNNASGTYSSAFGFSTSSTGNASHTEGISTIALNAFEHAEGRGNLSIKDKTVHTVGIGSLDGRDRKNAEEIHRSGDKYVIGIGGYDGTNSQTEGIKTVQEVVGEAANAVQITYAELKSLRDAGKLVPGTQYRITDYACTTIQAGTKSAGHVFDIIVTADDEITLNEVARAALHGGDTYFEGCNLNAWKLWYCLDNDTTRFAWADSTNGKGVIYRMIDEWNNDVPYDFKNIQYNGSWGYWAYTFNWIKDSSDNSCEDLSVAQYAHTNSDGGYSHTYGNVIKPCELGEGGNYGVPFKLNACVFLNTESYAGGYCFGCNSNTFENNCYNNTFRNNCYSNKFGNSCYSNSFGNNCYRNTFGNSCFNNNLNDYCYSNNFGNSCYSNAFSNNCYESILHEGCYSNIFGESGYRNTLGISCRYNTFGRGCYSNSFENNCAYNLLGDFCNSNTFGIYCYSNSFGNNCQYNIFNSYCQYIKFATDSSASTKYNYYQYNHFGNGCKYIVFTGAETASSSAQVQNYNFAQGLQGTSSAYLTIDAVRNKSVETKVAKKSNGQLKVYCEADLIM